jgi:signal transduction histidine kinase
MEKRDARRAGDRIYRGREADSQGFGLGLAIVREAVEAMNGTVSIETEPGAGTTVSVVLEAATPGEEQP